MVSYRVAFEDSRWGDGEKEKVLGLIATPYYFTPWEAEETVYTCYPSLSRQRHQFRQLEVAQSLLVLTAGVSLVMKVKLLDKLTISYTRLQHSIE